VGEAGFGGRVAARVLTTADTGGCRRPHLHGRRRGRALRPGQESLLNELLPQVALGIPAVGRIRPKDLFGPGRASIWLEIGFGSGEHLALQALTHPQIGLIGCEIFENGVVKLLAYIARWHLDNIRVFTDDARLLIGALPPASIDRVFILFPDPWPKRRHKKRRLLTGDTLDGLATIMPGGAELRLATDDQDYLCWMRERVTNHPDFEWLARRPQDCRVRPPDWPPTRYEEKARAAGRPTGFLRFRRRARVLS
jgi:tRNA (guanine-N7-)-methyltransferase